MIDSTPPRAWTSGCWRGFGWLVGCGCEPSQPPRTSQGCGINHLAGLETGEIDEHGLDAPVRLGGLRQLESAEDRVDVPLDRARRDAERPGGRGVAASLGDHRQDLALAW